MAYFEGILYALDKQGSIWQMQVMPRTVVRIV